MHDALADSPGEGFMVTSCGIEMKPPHDLTVMIVAASGATHRIIGEMFQTQRVVSATDGFEALAKIIDTCPDVIFIDTDISRLNGYRLCALIKRNHRFQATPVFLLSSRDGLFDKAQGRVVGANGFLTKPLESEALIEKIRVLFPDFMADDVPCG